MAAAELCCRHNLPEPTEPWTSLTIDGEKMHETAVLPTLQLFGISISVQPSLSGTELHEATIDGDKSRFTHTMPDGLILSTLQMVDSESTPPVIDGGRRLDLDSTKLGAASVRSSSQRDRNRFGKTSTTAPSTSRGKNLGTGSKSGQDSKRSNNVAPGISKRNRAPHDVDGPDTSHLPCKKRRLRHRLITSRLSQPYSLPATHILNRETGEDTPVLSRFLKFAAMGPKKAGHQTAMVRKAAILNRVRLNVRQAAVNRGHDRMWRMSDMSVMGHGLQLVTTSTGAMFPGRGSAAGMSLPRVWRPHTTGNHAGGATAVKGEPEGAVATHGGVATHYGSVTLSQQQQQSYSPAAQTLTTSIMTPLHHEETEDTSAFPVIEDDYRYADLSDDDMDDVYTDFGALFGGTAVKTPGDGVRDDEEEHFYEEYLDELDGIPWA